MKSKIKIEYKTQQWEVRGSGMECGLWQKTLTGLQMHDITLLTWMVGGGGVAKSHPGKQHFDWKAEG